MTRPQAEVYADEAGEWRWRLRAGNGEIVASGEGYTTKGDAVRGWMDMRDATVRAVLEVPA